MSRALFRSSFTPVWLVLAGLLACGGDDVTPGGTGGASVSSAGGAGATSSTATSAVTTGQGGAMDLPPLFTVTGVVLDGEGEPVEGAFVLQGGTSHEPPFFQTGPAGTFAIEMTYAGLGTPTVVASKIGYRTGGRDLFQLPSGPVELTLYAAEGPDNLGFEYGEPGQGDDESTAFCGHCHGQISAQFQTSKHAQATKDPLVQDLYAGVASALTDEASCLNAGGIWRTGMVPGTSQSTAFRCYLGAGVLPDLNGCGGPSESACDDPALPPSEQPTAFGACADCHAPGMAGPAGGRDLLAAQGVAYENGVFCGPCHKTSDVDLSKPAGTAGALVLMRPAESQNDMPGAPIRDVMYGPLLDVPNPFMGGSYQPKFSEAVFCAGCHEQQQPALIPGESLDPVRWPDGLPVHATYSEWLAGPYGASGTPCQHCHMPPNFELASTVDVTNAENASLTFGFVRPPSQIRKHIFRGPLMGPDRLLDQAAFVSVMATVGTSIEATVSVSNVGCGHALPTGEPMRGMILLLEGEACGAPLLAESGSTVDDVGGALASGEVGVEVSQSGVDLTWAAAAAVAQPGQIIRVVRPTGSYESYPGVGWFANPNLSPADKGRPLRAPLGEATVVAVAGAQLTTDVALPMISGDRVYLGEPLAPLEGGPSGAYAGAPGTTFAKVLVDAEGNRQAPHHRAVDIVSDNRIPAGGHGVSTHGFSLPGGCGAATLRATLLYRPHPLAEARKRAWEGKDYVVATAEQTIPLP